MKRERADRKRGRAPDMEEALRALPSPHTRLDRIRAMLQVSLDRANAEEDVKT